MKRYWRLALVIAVAGALAPGAGASTASAISVTDFLVTVKAIAPGSTPSVTFDGAGGSTSESGSSSGSPRPDQHHTSGSGQAFGNAATATSTSADPFAGGSAVIDGNVFGRGAVARASAFASSLVLASYGEGNIGLVNDVGAAAFTLAPGTLLMITARVTATASVTGGSPDEFAESGLLMAIGDATGLGPQRDYADFNVYASGLFGAYSDTETTVVTLLYRNDTDAAISGLFSGYVASYASSGDPPPASEAPEPGAASLMLAALLAAAARACRLRCRAARKPGGREPAGRAARSSTHPGAMP